MKRAIKKLSLDRETIRALTERETASVAGGMGPWTKTVDPRWCGNTEMIGGCWVTSITAPQYC